MTTMQVLGEPRIRCSSCLARVSLARSVKLVDLTRVFTCPRCGASHPVFGGGEDRR